LLEEGERRKGGLEGRKKTNTIRRREKTQLNRFKKNGSSRVEFVSLGDQKGEKKTIIGKGKNTSWQQCAEPVNLLGEKVQKRGKLTGEP